MTTSTSGRSLAQSSLSCFRPSGSQGLFRKFVKGGQNGLKDFFGGGNGIVRYIAPFSGVWGHTPDFFNKF